MRRGFEGPTKRFDGTPVGKFGNSKKEFFRRNDIEIAAVPVEI